MALDWRNWQVTAERDLAVAQSLINSGFFETAAFHAHQAAVSSLKALWLTHDVGMPPKVHDLNELGAAAEAPDRVRMACARLNPHYAGSRYPDAANGDPAANYDRPFATELLKAARTVYEWCSKQFPP